jgi:hypothetical protein
MLKLTPMILFLILLIVLVISIVIGRTSLNEGFISFQNNKQPADLVSVTCYSSTKQVTKIEDGIYFDQTNGNLLELDGSLNSTTPDSTGKTLTSMTILPRTGNEMRIFFLDTSGGTKPVIQDTDSSKIATLASSYSSRLYTAVSKNAQPATIVYIPWKQDTYIIPILTGTSMNNTTISNMYHFSSGNNVDTAAITSTASLTGFYTDTDASNNTMVIENVYDASRSVYQISHYVKFDIQNANLIVKNSETTAIIYDRYKSPITGLTSATNTTSVPNTGFSPWTVLDGSGQTIVFYIANGTNTVVALASFADATKTKLTLKNVVRFTSSGRDISSTATSTVPSTATSTASASSSSDSTSTLNPSPLSGTGGLGLSKFEDNAISDYFKWYWYWKSGAGSPGTDTSDYILKTQIIPPVCPAAASCPSCQNSGSGTCTNCGGNGGCGTVTSSGMSIFDICGNPTTCAKLGANGIGYDASKNKIMCYNNGGTGTSTTSSTGLGTTGKAMFDSNGQPNMYDSNGNPTSCAALGPNGIGYDANKAPMYCNPNALNSGIGQSNNNGLGGVANNAINTTGGLIGGAALGAGLLAEKAIDTTGGLISGAGTGASNLLTGAGTGASNLLTGAGRGISKILTPGQNGGQGYGADQGRGYGTGTGTGTGNNQRSTYYGTQNQYSDQYSYYGQLPAKSGSNYMPITTDFSAFGK